MMIVTKAVTMARRLIMDKLAAASCAVDATAGNGHDTLFLAEFVQCSAALWSFDIQERAIANTKKLLIEHGLAEKVQLIHDCHTQILRYVQQPVDIAMFNLGYMPGGDHTLTTQSETTLIAIGQLFSLLAVGGLVSIVAYPGHPAGREEHDALHNYLLTLPQTYYTVASWSMVNQENYPPVLYLIEKLRGEQA